MTPFTPGTEPCEAVPVDQPTKLCSTCGQRRPIDDFRRRYRGRDDRQGECRDCHNQRARDLRAKKRTRDLRGVAAAMNRRSAGRRAAAFSRAILGRFGGLERFVDDWSRELQLAAAQRPGSPAVLKCYLLIAQGLEIATAPEPRPDPSQMTDEELVTEMMSSVAPALLDDPELATIFDSADDFGHAGAQ